MRICRLAPIVVAAVVLAPVLAHAQTGPLSRMSLGIGYQMLHIPDETYPFGLNIDVAAPMSTATSLVGEFGFATDEQTEARVTGNLKFYNLAGGVRWTMPAASTGRRFLVPFAQMMVGAVQANADLTVNGARFRDGDWAFMLQPGAGVAVPIASIIGAVGQVDYRRAFFPSGENEFRLLLGIRVQGR